MASFKVFAILVTPKTLPPSVHSFPLISFAPATKTLSRIYKSIENWFNSDSNVNRPETIVDENFGWMFACGYYIDIAESYDVPVGGNGTIEEPFEIREGCSYYVDLPANGSLYYSFYNKNRDSEKLYWIKSSEPNALFEIDGTTYSSSEGPSAIIALGGAAGLAATGAPLKIAATSTVLKMSVGTAYPVSVPHTSHYYRQAHLHN